MCDWKRDCPDKSDEEEVCRGGSDGKCPDFMFTCGPVSQACISKVIIETVKHEKSKYKVSFFRS